MSKVFFVLLAILAFSVGKGSTLRCYSCSSSSVFPGVGCTSVSQDQSNIVTCSGRFDACLTTVSSSSITGQLITITARLCGSSISSTGCHDLAGTKTCLTTCTTDLCNSGADLGGGSVKLVGSVTALAFSALVAIIFGFN
uniref:UPAR/Ly6 domain-containing protein n=1 Tax=Ciona savignyi TaxID=51511 RepID=H2YRT2_CIOSA